MKTAGLSLFLCLGFSLSANADLTIVQKVEGMGSPAEMTIKIKGDKARIDANPQLTTIVNGKTGEMVNLMKDQKKIVRISAEKMKAAVEMMNKYSGEDKKAAAAKAKLTATGKKEKINGHDTEEYTYETPSFRASYWVARSYPDGATILKQLQSLNPEIWKAGSIKVPDYREFPGVPVKTIVFMSGNQVTTTIISIKQDAISDSEFVAPADFQEMKLPDFGSLLEDEEKKSAPSGSP